MNKLFENKPQKEDEANFVSKPHSDKWAYAVFGILCGIAITAFIIGPVLVIITHKPTNPIPPGQYFLIMLILSIIGAIIGVKFDKQANPYNAQTHLNKENVISKYTTPLVLGKRRVEGNFIIYPINQTRRILATALLFLFMYLTLRYISEPYNFVVWFLLIAVYYTAVFPQIRVSSKAISKKVVNDRGKKEIWYELK